MKQVLSAAAIAAMVGAAGVASARDTVQIAGSSTVLPYAKIVQDEFKEVFPDFNVVVESGGSSFGKKEVCKGVGEKFIDIGNSSSPIKDSEKAFCSENGVELIEITFGYDGIVFAYDNGAEQFDLTALDVYKALAANVGGSPNTVKTLKDVNPALPAWDVAFYIPAANHGTREVFEKKVMHSGCKASGDFEAYKAGGMSKKEAEKACATFRTGDGAVVEIAGDYTVTLARIDANKTGVGVFGLAFYENNKDKLFVADMEGVTPTTESIAAGEYPVSRPLFFFVKKAHLDVIPGLREYVDFFISEEMVGPGSPTVNYGLVPAPVAERDATRAKFATGDTVN
ncbi:MAG: substrate-binding domain-containing protein [Pseudomonadota bacterium]